MASNSQANNQHPDREILFKQLLDKAMENYSSSTASQFRSASTPENNSTPGGDSEGPRKFNLPVDLYIQDADEDFEKGGQAVLSLMTSWSYSELCDSLASQFKQIQKQEPPTTGLRRNCMDSGAVWSDLHQVSRIRAVSKCTVWDESAKSTVICESNCKIVLRAIGERHVLDALVVYIHRPDDASF